jgi:predicted  nucleic acid-binding Zn-ribbon protein
MKASADQQRSLADVVLIDAETTRLAHRRSHLPEHQRQDEMNSEQSTANDRLAALNLAVEDLEAQISRFEGEIDAVRQREDRDRGLLQSGSPNAKQLSELQHELDTLQRRQESLEDTLLEVMERREELQVERTRARGAIDALQTQLTALQRTRDEALAEIDGALGDLTERRAELLGGLDADFVALYERQRTATGIGAGLLQGRRCGACRIELDRGELARISAAADDEVLRCPECRAILLRVKGSGQ